MGRLGRCAAVGGTSDSLAASLSTDDPEIAMGSRVAK